MRILFWSEGFYPRIGGVEILATKLLSALRERGYDFVVVSQEERRNVEAARLQR